MLVNLPKQIIKDSQVVTNEWQLLPDHSDEAIAENTPILVPLSVWQAQQSSLAQRNDIGVWLKNDCELDSNIADLLLKLPIIAIDFPAFMDGRGFSIAYLLRNRYNYKGDLFAIGHIIRDQLCYLKRCGFNVFSFSDSEVDLTSALDSLSDFTESYQTSVDQPVPLFRRRAY